METYRVYVCRSCLTTFLVEESVDQWQTWEQMQRDIPCCDKPFIRRGLNPSSETKEIFLPEEPPKDRVELVLEDLEAG